MKIAFIILAYKNPDQVSSLIQSLTHPDHYFFLHIDAQKNSEPFNEALKRNKTANIIYLKRINSYWGSYNCVKAIIDGMQKAVQHPAAFDYYIHLSGQDFPVTSVSQIHQKLLASIPSSFLYHFPLPAPNWQKGGLDRLESCSLFFGGKRIVLNERSGNPVYKVLFKIWRKFQMNFDKNKSFFGGEFYFIFHKTAVLTFFENLHNNRSLANRLKYTLIPEEIFIPTILLQDTGSLVIRNETLRYIRWESTGRSPADLTEKDFSEIVEGDFLFARKFDFEKDPELENLLTNLIRQKSTVNENS